MVDHRNRVFASDGDLLWDGLPWGLFWVQNEEIQGVNRALRERLGAEEGAFLARSYRDLLDRLMDLGDQPQQLYEDFNTALARVNQIPEVTFTITEQTKEHWSLFLFPLERSEQDARMWGGMLWETSRVQYTIEFQQHLLNRFLVETRRPLASLEGNVKALLANLRLWQPDLIEEFLENIHQDLRKVIASADQGAALMRIRREEAFLRPESVNLSALLRRALEAIRNQQDRFSFQIGKVPDQVIVRADPLRLKEALLSLLKSLETTAEKPLHVDVTVEQKRFWVQINFKFRAFQFSPRQEGVLSGDHRLDPGQGQTGPLFDLYLAQKQILAHGGKIWIETPFPDLGEGSRLAFTLPAMPGEITEPSSSPLRTRKPGDQDQTVLIVEHRPDIQHYLRSIFQDRGYEAKIAVDERSMLDIIAASPPDLILLPEALPHVDGVMLCRAIRRWSSLPIIMLTTRSRLEDLVSAFEAGVDDYLVSPFQSRELLLRAEALLYRDGLQQTATDPDVFERAGVRINYNTQEVWVRGVRMEFTPIEYRLLAYMSRHRRQVLTYEQMIQSIWETPEAGSRQGLFTHISRLREKIEQDPKNPKYIKTRWGVGYVFMPEY